MTDRADAYRRAGVDITAAGRLVDRIKPLAQATFNKGVITDIGGFGGLFKLDLQSYEEPVLVSSTDGVGTKLLLAFEFDGHSTVGIDLVAMSVNDILVQGAKPLFFLDYFATGKLDVDTAERVIKGVAHGCSEAGCALLGGETAEMPDFYPPGHYDLAGFCVGIVDNTKIVDGSSIGIGDSVIGIKSSGPHSNGYSLIRKILAESGLRPNDLLPGASQTVAEALLAPTRIYVKSVLNLLRDFPIKGMVHVTGGGFYENIPRILPRGVAARVSMNSWPMPPVFRWLKDAGKLTWPEMLTTFNCGVGFVLVVGKDILEDVMNRLNALHEQAWVIGEIERLPQDGERVQVSLAEE
ncbi:Phosphoribosylformylglycinamidine cyclo-ligase [Fundidesulfovibrio magnetotacticus]|uniref:Phosphoribosylformylglycinamidine cyclo-ligase n=1 Tax=Fundidesulfovibrio magnetotacticus TaxID=2730080 RepID=A0A6V8LUT8_9BACT|nr:phosphoribosylformylglycinamidine cyclo-ligase [Fundidesulfovibrio magnetotacticus]GFK93576.1 Phosphoribosylformylglycinamidine cyclo-ligase [Fundidesulfovibrio magnetotacticus]